MTTVVIFFLWKAGSRTPGNDNGHFVNLLRFFLLPMTASRSGRTLPYPRRTSLPAGPSHINQSAIPLTGWRSGESNPVKFLYLCPGFPTPVNLRPSRSDRHGVTGDCYDLVVLRPVGRYGARGSISALLDDKMRPYLTLRTFPGLGAHHCACLASNTLCCSICFRPWLYTEQTQARRR